MNAPHLSLINENIMRIVNGEINRLMVFLPPRHGKALSLDTPIPTPHGWTTMGELRIGDVIFSDTGEPCKVIAKSEVFKNRPVYKVKTDSGDEITADAGHEWFVRLCRKHKKYLLKTTEYLANRTCDRKPQMQQIKPLVLPERDHPIDPYILGLWLGDGRTHSSSFCTADQEILDEIERIEGNITYYQNINGTQHFRAGPHYRMGATKYETLQGRLRALGVLGDKHIPIQYLRASIEQRKRLLQGLIDTDGYVSNAGQIEYCSTSKRLAEEVRELINSLGVKASIITGDAKCNGKNCGIKYRVMFYMEGAAKIERKAIKTKNGTRQPGTYLSFEPCGYADTVCIQVDSPSHLFLCGKTMIPTHNSELISKYTPAWYLGTFPDNRVILTSYEADFAAQWGRRSRDLLEEHGNIFPGNIKIRGDSSAANRWDIADHSGGMVTAGVRGPITGKGANCIIIDDPVKNAEEAASQTYRDRAWEWYKSTLYTRLEPGGAIILIQTRWHEDDLAGRILNEMYQEDGEQWEIISIPAIAEPNDVLGRQVGDPLWPERFPINELNKIKTTLGSYWFAALYQQRPAPAEGGLFKRHWFDIVDDYPRDCSQVRRWDLASSQNKGDYTAGLKVGEKNGIFYVIDLKHIQENPAGVEDLIKQTAALDTVRTAVRMEQEPGSSGVNTIDHYARFVLKGYNFQGVRSTGSKVERARSVSAAAEVGNVKIVKAPWNTIFLDEIGIFPNGAHDDIVDTLTGAFTDLTLDRIIRSVYEPTVEEAVANTGEDSDRYGTDSDFFDTIDNLEGLF